MAPPNFLANAGFIRLIWSINGELAFNVQGLLIPPGIAVNQALADTVGAGVKNAFGTQLAPQLATTTRLEKVGLRDFRQPNQAEFRDIGAAVPGSAVGDSLPNSTAMCLTVRTALAGRSFRGRFYLGGFVEAANGPDGRAVAGAVSAALAFASGMNSAINAGGMNWAVISRPAEAAVITKTTTDAAGNKTEDVLYTIKQKAGSVTAAIAFESRDVRWETQRRRGNGRGTGVAAFLGGTRIEIQ